MATKAKAKPKAKPAKKVASKSRAKLTDFQWNFQRSQAAQMIADGQLPIEQVAEKVGVSKQTLFKWKLVPEFQLRVKENAEAIAEALKGAGIREKQLRVDNLQARVTKMLQLIEARGEEMANEVAGGATGLLVRDWKGKDCDVAVYRFDAGLLKELREHEKQAAIELGQWTEKQEHTVATPITVIKMMKPHGAD